MTTAEIAATAAGRSRRRFTLVREYGGWTLRGASEHSTIEFPDLPEALAYAREDARAEAADIELWVDGLYLSVHQAPGWPHPICGVSARAMRRGPGRH